MPQFQEIFELRFLNGPSSGLQSVLPDKNQKKSTLSLLQALKSFQDMQLPPPERREGPLEKRSKGVQIRVEGCGSVIELREGILGDSFGVNGVKLRQRIQKKVES